MVGFAPRFAINTLVFALAMACSGCAAWREEPFTLAVWQTTPHAPPPMIGAEFIQPADHAPLPSTLNEPEDFLCADGSRLRVGYSRGRDTVRVSLNGATPIALRRADEAGLTSYRAANLVFRRSGPRVALASDQASVTVHEGDTLGVIAARVYGERTRAMDIASLNEIANPDLIFPGQVLRLPVMERRCQRFQAEEIAYTSAARSRALDRRLFTPPSERIPELHRTRLPSDSPTQ